MPNPSEPFSSFGNKLIKAGYIKPEQLSQALVQVRKSGKPLLKIIEEITERQLPANLVREYKKLHLFELKILYGVDSIDPEVETIPDDDMAEIIDTLISIDICRRYKLLPLKQQGTEPASILVAMVDPDNLEALDDLKRILRPKLLGLQRIVITEEDYNRLLKKYYQLKEQKDLLKAKQKKDKEADKLGDLSGILEDIGNLQETGEETEAEIGANQANEAPVTKLVNQILVKAISEDASEILIEPQEEGMRVRLRKDGILQTAFTLPRKLHTAIVSRIKIMADLSIGQKSIPKYSLIKRFFQGKRVDFYVNFFGSRFGEKVIIKVCSKDSTFFNLEHLIKVEKVLKTVKKMLAQKGLILVTGTGDSGKTTTLYSLLASLISPEIDIITVEETMEYRFNGITQIRVVSENKYNYDSVLKSLENNNFDVILVDKIQDTKRFQSLVKHTLKGCLGLSSFLSNNVIDSIFQLQQMGVSSELIAASLIGVINQRLIRRVCFECCIDYAPEPEEIKRFSITEIESNKLILHKANVLSNWEMQTKYENRTLCPNCRGKGYKGRIGVYEVLHLNQSLKSLISKESDGETLIKAAVKQGMIPQFNYGLNLVLQGYTTLAEIERVFPESEPWDLSSVETPIEETAQLELLNKLMEKLDRLPQQFLEIMLDNFPQLKQSSNLDAVNNQQKKNFSIEDPWEN